MKIEVWRELNLLLFNSSNASAGANGVRNGLQSTMSSADPFLQKRNSIFLTFPKPDRIFRRLGMYAGPKRGPCTCASGAVTTTRTTHETMKPRTHQPTNESTHESMKPATSTQIESMCAKVRCAHRKGPQFKNLRQQPQPRILSPGYKQSPSQLQVAVRCGPVLSDRKSVV